MTTARNTAELPRKVNFLAIAREFRGNAETGISTSPLLPTGVSISTIHFNPRKGKKSQRPKVFHVVGDLRESLILQKEAAQPASEFASKSKLLLLSATCVLVAQDSPIFSINNVRV
jgi:hypothetical protein